MDPKTALLDWATKVSTTDQTPPSRPLMQPGQIDAKWFKALFGDEKEVDRMRKLLDQLDLADHDRRLEILADLEYMCELTHNANDLTKIGGLQKLFDYVVADDDDVQIASLNVLGICIPNNPDFCQALMGAEERFATLYDVFQHGRSETIRSKAFWAISGLVKALPVAFSRFVSDADCIKALVDAVQDPSSLRILRRAINLIDFMEVQQPHCFGSDLPRLLLDCLRNVDDVDSCEQIVVLLRKLHDRGEKLGDDAVPTLKATGDRVPTNRESDHDPEILLRAIDSLINALM